MALILANYIKFMGFELPAGKVEAFNDEAEISSWALEAVRMIQAAGIINGKGGGIYDPKGIATRAEIAAIFARFIEILADDATERQSSALSHSSASMDIYIDKSALEALARSLAAAADEGEPDTAV